ncbi:protein snakeskin [Nilaparvata lugens]|uniref:protein snakeskin n=1 Tax=Nilaparvata lugens TaxID=108931 RepID=UPI000B97EDEB|nr:protein snakeskin [Nilaparvata lugens]
MTDIASTATLFIKGIKMILIIIILLIYRFGYQGQFLGVGGTWNLNEEKNPDAEIIASGVFVGFFIYTGVVLITYCFGTSEHKKTLVDIIMNIFGAVMFIAVGGVAIHYWAGYQKEHRYQSYSSEKQMGLGLGCLCVLTGAVYLLDTVLSVVHFVREL